MRISDWSSDVCSSDLLSITVSGMPVGAMLSAGTDNGDGSWTLAPADLQGLAITPLANSDVDFQFSVTATATAGANGETATTTGTIDVTVGAVADAPEIAATDASGRSVEQTLVILSLMGISN